MSEPLPSFETARAAFSSDNNIAIGFGRILYSNGSWRLPGGSTTTNREWAETIARWIDGVQRRQLGW